MVPIEDILSAGEHQGIAFAGGVLAAVVALYIVSEKGRTTRTQKHWEEVCRRTLRDRDGKEHKILQSGDVNKVGRGRRLSG